MTLIYTPRHMDQLVSEIKHEWPKNDPDLQRVADALPLANIEAAYVKKLEIEARSHLTIIRAETVSQKLLVMRKIYLAWLSSPQERLGQLICNAFRSHDEQSLFYMEDGILANATEKGYPPE
jgi:hypothetical protein